MIEVTDVQLASEEWVKAVADCIIKRERNDIYVSMLQRNFVCIVRLYYWTFGPLCVN